MKPWLTLTLTVSLITSSLPAQAQPTHTYSPNNSSNNSSNLSDWAYVAAIAPGTKVAVSAVGLGGQDSQYFISATDRELTLLALANADLPTSARKFVIKLAGTHPDIFLAPQRWIEYGDGSSRVTPDGVFVRGHKVADLSDITRTLRAGDVAQVSTWVKDDRPAPMPFDPSVAGVAAILPLSALALACGDGGHCSSGLGWGVILGVPAAVGVVHMVRAGRRQRQEVVYRAR
jgi:hypothetical protein